MLDGLKRLAALTPPNVRGAGGRDRLRQCGAERRPHGTDAARSLARARLLEQALAFHASRHGHGVSRVRLAGGLNAKWKTRSQQEVDALNAEATAVRTAAERSQRRPCEPRARWCAIRRAALPRGRRGWRRRQSLRERGMGAVARRHLDKPRSWPITSKRTRSCWRRRRALPPKPAGAVARRGRVASAGQLLAQWRRARSTSRTKEHVDQLKEAEEWWKAATEDIRNERFEPIAARAMDLVEAAAAAEQRQPGRDGARGHGDKRRVALKVTVDGKDAEALGVMSQGELHSLALSLFLPRATLPESPFRFICVDDPVQSMDPARVEGLARAWPTPPRRGRWWCSRTTTGCPRRCAGWESRQPRSE